MNALRWAVLVIAVLVMNMPVIVTIVTSLKPPAEIMSNPGLIVESPTLANYATVVTVSDRLNVWAYLTNSVVAASIGSLIAEGNLVEPRVFTVPTLPDLSSSRRPH